MANGVEKWIETLVSAEKTCLVQDGRRKIHFTFADKTEMTEEYNVQTGELIVRKWRKKSALGAVLPWEFEIGLNTDEMVGKPLNANIEIAENSSNPVFSRQDTTRAFQWRIRNLNYPSDNYIVELDDQHRVIVVKTKNKKYYKKINVQDLDRIGMGLDAKNLSFKHANNTLVITYEKPSVVLDMERRIQSELSKIKATKEGDVECKPS